MIHGNRSVLHKSPGRFLAGTVASGDRSAFSKHGMLRSAAFDRKAGRPRGYLAPVAWVLPQVGGSMTSHLEARITYNAAATGLMGLPGTGSASYSITTNAPAGGLIVSGAGTASYSITTNAPLLKAVINGTGAASYAITTNTPTLGAIASLVGTASYSFTAAGTLRGIGHMTGSSIPGGGITVTVDTAAIAAAVWAQALEAGITAAEFQRIMAAALAGTVTGMGANAPVFRGIGDTRDRITATTDTAGNRLAVTLDGAP